MGFSLTPAKMEGIQQIDEEEKKDNSPSPQFQSMQQEHATREEIRPAGFFISEEQKKLAEIMGGGQRMESRLFSLNGFRIVDNTTDREVFVICPMCKLDVFDSGLNNEIM